MTTKPLARGIVESLSVEGKPVEALYFKLEGPRGDSHSGFSKALGKHDGEYRRTSDLKKGDPVFNWRSWTGLSTEELSEIEHAIGVRIPPGILLENIVVSCIPSFSKLPPTSRLVFPSRVVTGRGASQAILTVWEENTPCNIVGKRLEERYGEEGLSTRFVAAAKDRRGVMGLVLSAGMVRLGDTVAVYPPR